MHSFKDPAIDGVKMEKKVCNIPEEVLVDHYDLQVILFLVKQLGTFCTTCEKEFKFNLSTLQHEKQGHIHCTECRVFHNCSKKKTKWKWQILQKISLPITARLKILLIRGKYDPQMCAKCELYKEHGLKYG